MINNDKLSNKQLRRLLEGGVPIIQLIKRYYQLKHSRAFSFKEVHDTIIKEGISNIVINYLLYENGFVDFIE